MAMAMASCMGPAQLQKVISTCTGNETAGHHHDAVSDSDCCYVLH
jgi:hypothetical protein